jgi:hypothetical protein
MNEFGKDAWVEMLRAIGLEARWPDAHESVLAWLGVAKADIARIRSSSRSAAHNP